MARPTSPNRMDGGIIDFLHRLWELQSRSLTEDEDIADRLLVEQVIAGSRPDGQDPYKVFIDRYGPVVVRVLRRFRISQQDRDDCWQTIFWRLFENDSARLKAWRGGSLSGYIAVTARRVAIDRLRTTNPEVQLPPGFDPPSPDEPGCGTPGLPSEAIIRQVASTCLTPRQFEIYERYCRGENTEETGKALKMTQNHVYVERNRMIRALRECLKKQGLWPS
jgi:DNA-directed RNA polymerase specialized sigma24 family protein